MIRGFTIILLSLGLTACGTLAPPRQSQTNAALKAQVDQLEYEIAKMKKENRDNTAAGVVFSDPWADPVEQSARVIRSIETSSAHNISALRNVHGNYGTDVRVYPLDVNKSSVNSILNSRTQEYPRHVLQLGQDVHTTQHSQDIIIYPLQDATYEEVKLQDMEPVKAQTLTRYDKAETSTNYAPTPHNNPRRLTGY